MTAQEDRQKVMEQIEVACREGARLEPACEIAGLDVRTVQRWRGRKGKGDGRPQAVRPMPAHALSEAERARLLEVVNEPRFADMPPARIVPALADEGQYLASESSFSRVMRAEGQSRHRGRARAPRPGKAPTTHVASAPGEVWCWDMTYLPSTVTGQWFYLYLILDLYSRKIIGFEVHDRDSSEHAVEVLKRVALTEGLHGRAPEHRPVLHGDNGATLKATSVLAMLHWLQIRPSYSRPRVSDDNAFVESVFRTAKYRPEFPASGGFKDLQAARQWASDFVHWYNHDHHHSGIRYVSPAQRHAGQDRQILAARDALYQQARQANPKRWSGKTRDWSPVGAVTLNPERDCVTAAIDTATPEISGVTA
jgi:transposase InsO family protein